MRLTWSPTLWPSAWRGDLIGSVGVIIAGALIIGLGWKLADPVFGVIIGIIVVVTSGRLALKVLAF